MSRHQAAPARLASRPATCCGSRPHSASVLPRPRRVAPPRARPSPPPSAAGAARRVLRPDGQLEDDARLVVTIARTAAAHGATSHPGRGRAGHRHGAVLTDTLTGRSSRVRARAVINATGVWAGELRPGRPAAAQPRHPPGLRRRHPAGHRAPRSWCRARLHQPVRVRAAAADRPRLRRPHRRARAGPIPDEPQPTEDEIDVPARHRSTPASTGPSARRRRRRLRRAAAADRHRRRQHRRPVAPARRPGRRTGAVTVLGGKLTTYRRMAQDAVDAAVAPRPGRRAVPHPASRCSVPRARRARPLDAPAGWSPLRRGGRACSPTRRRHRPPGELLAPVSTVPHPRRARLRRHPRGRPRRRRRAPPAHPVGLVPADRALAVPLANGRWPWSPTARWYPR